MLLSGPSDRSLVTSPEWHADSITLQGLGWVVSHQNGCEGGGVFFTGRPLKAVTPSCAKSELRRWMLRRGEVIGAGSVTRL